MMNRIVLFSLAMVLSFPFSVGASKPNVILILSDDAGYADFGVTGSTLVPTPHIDRLAQEGVFCSQGYVTASTCTPSRMGLMSGRYQQRFGAECNVPTIPTPGYTKEDLGLDTSERTLGEVMKSQGYRTMAIGKWHLGELPKYHPNERGFDEFYGFLGGSRSYWPIDKPSRGAAILRNEEPVDEASEITYLTDNFTDAAMEFIDRNQQHPFFIYLAYNAVHGPFHAKEEDLEQCPKIDPKVRWMVSAMTRSMDDNVGRLLARLDRLGLTENTLIMFVNDNGGTQGDAHSNGSLRGFKGTYWEGGIRVPFILSWPAQVPKGQRFDEPVSSLDLLPTCLAAAGGQPDPAWALDGVNLLPYFQGQREGAPHETLFWRFWRVSVVREGPWKLLRVAENPLEEKRPLLAPLMLVNLDDDPAETRNLAREHPAKTQSLLAKLEAWEKPLAQPRWYDGSAWRHWQEEQLKNHTMTD
jgi:arylsulfatase A-like enzyme